MRAWPSSPSAALPISRKRRASSRPPGRTGPSRRDADPDRHRLAARARVGAWPDGRGARGSDPAPPLPPLAGPVRAPAPGRLNPAADRDGGVRPAADRLGPAAAVLGGAPRAPAVAPGSRRGPGGEPGARGRRRRRRLARVRRSQYRRRHVLPASQPPARARPNPARAPTRRGEMKTTALAMLVLRTPRGALVRARVEPTPHGDAPCSICEALDEHLEYAGVIDVRVGADCAICGSIVHHVS